MRNFAIYSHIIFPSFRLKSKNFLVDICTYINLHFSLGFFLESIVFATSSLIKSSFSGSQFSFLFSCQEINARCIGKVIFLAYARLDSGCDLDFTASTKFCWCPGDRVIVLGILGISSMVTPLIVMDRVL